MSQIVDVRTYKDKKDTKKRVMIVKTVTEYFVLLLNGSWRKVEAYDKFTLEDSLVVTD